ncbi:MAG TPA: hypothetical protein VGC32_09040 [Solirubrobacterales bacterium]
MRAVRRAGIALLVAVVALGASVGVAAAARGRGIHLDRGFGTGGRTVVTLPDAYRSANFGPIVSAAGGRFLVGYDSEEGREPDGNLVQRREPDGALDPSFGSGGSTVVPGYVTALAEGPEGRIVYGAGDYLGRLESDGAPDPIFGTSEGRYSFPSPGFATEAIAFAPGGQILVAGHYTGTSERTTEATAVMRFEPNGTLDTGFGKEGVAQISYNGPGNFLAVAADGSILALGATVQRLSATGSVEAGFSVAPSGQSNAMVVFPDGEFAVASTDTAPGEGSTTCTVSRYRADGSLDPSFAQGGVLTRPGLACSGLVVAPEEGLLAYEASSRYSHRTAAPRLLRLNASGAPVAGFGAEGEISLDPPAPSGGAEPHPLAIAGVAFAGNGKILVAGSDVDATLVRLEPDGALDPGFGAGGAISESVQVPSRVSPRALAVTSGGRLMVTGMTDSGRLRRHPFLMSFTASGKLRPTATGAPFSPLPISGSTLFPSRGKLYALASRGTRYVLKFDHEGRGVRGFGKGGYVEVPGERDAASFIVDPDGGITLFGVLSHLGRMFAYRMAPSGKPDPGFGKGGLVLVDFGKETRSRALSAVRLPGGDLVLAGVAGNRLALARIGPHGELRRSFGHQGKLVCDCHGGRPERIKMAVDGDSIYVVDGWEPEEGHSSSALVKVGLDGVVDRSFGIGGARRIGTGRPDAVFARGKRLVVVGQRNVLGGPGRIGVFRLDGTPDRSFARGGVLTVGNHNSSRISAVEESDGRLVVALERGGKLESEGSSLELIAFGS